MTAIAIFLDRPGVAERIRGTRIDVLAALSDKGPEVWLADGDRGEVFARIPASHIGELVEFIAKAAERAEKWMPGDSAYGDYPPAGSVR